MEIRPVNTKRKLLFTCLYLSEGAPIGFLWLALPTRLRASGVPIEQITWLTAVLVLPWTFKFAWAPLIDLLQNSRWSLRSWIVTAQSVMGLTLLSLLVLDPVSDFQQLSMFLLVHAFAAATQDVAIDALCISVTSPAERGEINGWMQTGMLLGRAMLGGGALVISPYIGNQGVVWFCSWPGIRRADRPLANQSLTKADCALWAGRFVWRLASEILGSDSRSL